MDVIVARLVEEHLEVAHDSVGSLPSFTHAPRLRDLDPSLAGCAHTMVDVYTEGKLGYKEREEVRVGSDSSTKWALLGGTSTYSRILYPMT